MCRGTCSAILLIPCPRLVHGVAPVTVNKHLWAVAHIPEGQKELGTTKDDLKQPEFVFSGGLDGPPVGGRKEFKGVACCCRGFPVRLAHGSICQHTEGTSGRAQVVP